MIPHAFTASRSLLSWPTLAVPITALTLFSSSPVLAANPELFTRGTTIAQATVASPTPTTTTTTTPTINTPPMGTGTTSTGAATGTPSGTNQPGTTTTANQTRFTCQLVNGQYTVLYQPESQPSQQYPWAVPGAMGGGWSPDRRCYEISRRLESYRPDGLQEMRNSVENGYNVICVTTQSNPNCRIVLTVPPGQDPMITRDRVFQNLTVADSGQQTQGVNTFLGNGDTGVLGDLVNLGRAALGDGEMSNRSGNINLRPFLDRADGGTGTRLGNGVPMRANPRLNPDRFR